MNAIGIDVSKGKSTVAVLRPFGEVVASPFDVAHTGGDLRALADFIKKLPGEKKDSLKIASYALSYWIDLKEYVPQEDLRKSLKLLNRQYQQASKLKTMMNNNLISLLDLTFLGVNKLFTSPSRESDGHEKWVDFVLAFPLCDMISKLTIKAFARK